MNNKQRIWNEEMFWNMHQNSFLVYVSISHTVWHLQ